MEETYDEIKKEWPLDEKCYVVVKFIEEGNAIAVIHRNWLIGNNSCLWPLDPCSEELLKSGEVDSTWKLYSCRILSRTDNLENARAKVRKVEIGSEKEMSDKEVVKEKSPEKKRQRLSCPDEENFAKESQATENELPPIDENLQISIDSVSEAPRKETEAELTFSDKLLSKLDSIIEGQKNTQNVLEKILLEQSCLKKQVVSLNHQTNGFKENCFALEKFPLNTVDAFKCMEESLKADIVLRDEIVQWLSCHMGATLEESVCSCLRAILSDEIVTLVTWSGKTKPALFLSLDFRQKLCMKESALFSLLIVALRNGNAQFSVDKASDHTKLWLRRAADRMQKFNRKNYKENQSYL